MANESPEQQQVEAESVDTPQFRQLLDECEWQEHACRVTNEASNKQDWAKQEAAERALIAHIGSIIAARVAAGRQDGYLEGVGEQMDALAASQAAPAKAEDIPDVLFDGYAVYSEVTAGIKSNCRTSAENVSDTLDAVVRLMRREGLAAKAEGWQPIATAPKDGANVLLVNYAQNIAAGLWQGNGESMGWWLRGGNAPNVFFNGHHGPTHWMPLPAAPSTQPGEQHG